MVGPLVELGVSDQHDHPRADALRPEPERRTDAEGEAVSERPGGDLDPGDQVPVRVVAER